MVTLLSLKLKVKMAKQVAKKKEEISDSQENHIIEEYKELNEKVDFVLEKIHQRKNKLSAK